MASPLRFLFILHHPLSRELGAPLCYAELADALRALGHQVTVFDLPQALPRPGPLTAIFARFLFARQAVHQVCQQGQQYDVIMAGQGDLPVPRERLKFSGVLITRSDGLAHFYAQAEAEAERSRSALSLQGFRPRRLVGRILRRFARWLHEEVPCAEQSFRNADLITVPNHDEVAKLRELGYGSRTVFLPSGLTDDRWTLFEKHRSLPETRHTHFTVSFIGTWNVRKGSEDFPVLLRQVRQRHPSVRLRLLGTGKGAEAVIRCFSEEDRPSVCVVPHFRPEELPELLRETRVGLLPSRIEGFPMAVLEMLAAGIPVVAYDAPGAREMLQHISYPLLTPVGQPIACADRISSILQLPLLDYEALSTTCWQTASPYRWSQSARMLLEACTLGTKAQRCAGDP